MSEVWRAQGPTGSAALDGPDRVDSALSAGAMLRRAREAAGLHVAALAVSLKVPVRKVEALEGDRHDLLTDTVFARALASSICRTLKIDAQPVLERLPSRAAPRLMRKSETLNEPFRAPSDGAPPTWLDQLSRPVFLAVFALLLGALVLILLPKAQQDNPMPATTTTTTTPVPLNPPAAVTAAPAVPAVQEAATAVVSPATAPAPQEAVVPAPAATAASGIVLFRTKAPSWVEVTDAAGVVAVRKVLEAGEAAGASGALPLRVTIGSVDATEVQVRGKPFDLSRVSKDNVARFEVK